MATTCAICAERPSTVGLLCVGCAGQLPACDGLLPEHIHGDVRFEDAGAWLVDGWGNAHALSAPRTSIGRVGESDLVILNASVSREHARLSLHAERWEVRDLGSRNWTQLDGTRVQSSAQLRDGARLRFGDVSFFFKTELADPPQAARPVVTTQAADSGTVRYTLRGEAAAKELCLLGTTEAQNEATGGVLLHRDAGDDAWAELNLPPLEFSLLRSLCQQWLEEAGSPAKARGCVATKRLAKDLPFQSRYANEENVRQVVRRLRATLKKVGVTDLVSAVPGRGYYVAWPVSSF